MSLQTRHLELVDAVNDAETEFDRGEAEKILRGFRYAMETLGWVGSHLTEADIHTMARFGDDRPMCCGVLLDWEPKLGSKLPNGNNEAT